MAQYAKPPLPTNTLVKARTLRDTLTEAERELWFHLRAKRLGGLKFRRQHPIPPYIVDFFCEAAGLVVELDGSQHTPAGDASRTAYIEAQGLYVIRFSSNVVLNQTRSVIEAIWNLATHRTLSPTPLPEGEGLKWTPGHQQ